MIKIKQTLQMMMAIITTMINIIKVMTLIIVGMESMNLSLMKIVTMEIYQVVKTVKLFMGGSVFPYVFIVHIVGLCPLLLLLSVGMENMNLIMEKNVMILT